MARSHVIYVVLNGGEQPVAAFTVKHEMLTWVTQWARGEGIETVRYRRMPDCPNRGESPLGEVIEVAVD